MDFFGIGAAIKGFVNVYFQSAAQTGRTTFMMKNLKDGDRIIFRNVHEAQCGKILCREYRKNIECIVIPVNKIFESIGQLQRRGRTIFDHMWIEDFYKNITKETIEKIDILQEQLSDPKFHDEEFINNRFKMKKKKWNRIY